MADELERALAVAEVPRAPLLSRASVPRELLRKPTVARLLRFALTDWAMIFALWFVMWHSPYWLYPPLALLLGGRFHALGVVLHDVTHMPLRGKPFGVRVLEVLTGYPVSSTVNAMRYHHLRHHKDSGMPTDPYFKPSVRGRPLIYIAIWLRHLLLWPVWTLRGPYGLLALAIPKMRTSYAFVFMQDRSGKDLTHDPEVIACAKAELGQVLFHAAVVVLAVMHPQLVLWYFVVPITVSALLAGYRVLREHDYVAVTDRSIKTIIATTTDHNLGPLGRVLFAPRNIGYHIVHHLHPQVALDALPRLRAWYVKEHGESYPPPYGARRAARGT